MEGQEKKVKLFREKSLEAIESPESLNDYIRVTSPSVWIALLALVVLLVGLLAWSVFGRIEVKDANGGVKEIAPITYIIN